MQYVDPSREVLAETLLAAGPGAATLCEGWRTQELAAHLYLREHNPRVGLGMVFRPLKSVSDKAISALAEESSTPAAYTALVEKFRAGPPKISPFALKTVDKNANLTEFFVHTEDIRRATDRWAPRTLDDGYSLALWAELLKRAAILYRGVDLGIVLVSPQGPRHVAKRAPVSVAIIGDPGELLLHANGRTGQALVSFEGQPDAVALLQTADVGL
ncbi:TIGR03085 family metal-binding protein [Specibacter sp. NPDC057265]|uniref:TIGR03085 family metal-binding protein n=1 Tax=Specibacter sp. NPDC057265 TaxID=3346075 RepID=UPI00363C3A07